MKALLFAGDHYEERGGWGDFVAEFPTIADARRSVDVTRTETVIPAHVSRFDTTLRRTTSSIKPMRAAVGDRYNEGTITAIQDGVAMVSVPEIIRIRWAYQWAQIVAGNQIVARFADGQWFTE